MDQTISVLNFVLALGGIMLGFGALVIYFDHFTKNYNLRTIIGNYGLFIAFLLTFVSSGMSLIYSEIFGFVPCGLCWLQRICLYPQALMLGYAVYHKDKNVARYGILLSIPGIVVSFYQHYLQMGGVELVTCPTVAAGADCAERILFEFGFMTFPLMSTFLFIFLIALYTYILKSDQVG